MNEIINLGVTDKAIAELREKYSIVPDATTKKGYNEIKVIKSVLTPLWTGIEKERKLQVAEALAHQKGVNARAKFLTAELKGIWGPNEAAKKSVDDEKKRLEDEKVEADRVRIESIERNINSIKELRNVQYGASSKVLKENLDVLDAFYNDFDYQEFDDIAKNEFKKTMSIIEIALDACVKLEEERKAQELKQIEQDKKQAELNAKQAEFDKRQAELEKVEYEKKVKEQAEENAKLAAAKAAQDAINEQNRLAQLEIDKANKAAAKAESDRLALIESQKKEADAKKQAELDEIAAQEKRDSDKKHTKKVNNEALNCLIDEGISEENAKKVIILICRNKVDHIKITY